MAAATSDAAKAGSAGCAQCGKPAPEGKSLQVCSRCRSVKYCGVECQRAAWPEHKLPCRAIKAEADAKAGKAVAPDGSAEVDEDVLRIKAEHARFQVVVKKYGLDDDAKSSAISDYLTGQEAEQKKNPQAVFSSRDFADKFGLEHDDALAFLRFVNTGVHFKENHMRGADALGM